MGKNMAVLSSGNKTKISPYDAINLQFKFVNVTYFSKLPLCSSIRYQHKINSQCV